MKTSRRKLSALPARLTLRDLAEHASVSPATVSLVLRKSPLVADATRKRVLESVRELGYVYNRGAASLRTQRTHTVGVSMNELVNPYFAELTAAIESRAVAESMVRILPFLQLEPVIRMFETWIGAAKFRSAWVSFLIADSRSSPCAITLARSGS